MRRLIPVLIVAGGLGVLYPMQRWIDRVAPRETISEENLYFASGEAIKKLSLGLEAIVADIYWIRTVQYFGRKVVESGGLINPASTKDIRMDLLAPLLNIVVTLDPQHIPAYRFGAIFLPERDMPAALELLHRGINQNPGNWRLYQDLGYIYWQSGDYAKAAEIYDQGSRIQDAMWWMHDLAGLMRINGNSRDAARVVYSSYLDADDTNIREQAVARLKQIHALDELDLINAALNRYRQQTGSCPQSLRVLARTFNSIGLHLNQDLLPVDPDGYPYYFDVYNCRADIAWESSLPRLAQ